MLKVGDRVFIERIGPEGCWSTDPEHFLHKEGVIVEIITSRRWPFKVEVPGAGTAVFGANELAQLPEPR